MWNTEAEQVVKKDALCLCIDNAIHFVHPTIEDWSIVLAPNTVIAWPRIQEFHLAAGPSKFYMEEAYGQLPFFLQTHKCEAFP